MEQSKRRTHLTNDVIQSIADMELCQSRYETADKQFQQCVQHLNTATNQLNEAKRRFNRLAIGVKIVNEKS